MSFQGMDLMQQFFSEQMEKHSPRTKQNYLRDSFGLVVEFLL